jgi:mono/diheme cytochrome c family protein
MTLKIFLTPLVVALALISLASAAEESAPTELSIKRQQQLRQLLLQDCSVCHGKLLSGDRGPALTPESLAGKNEETLVRTIVEGHKETEMPSWAWKMADNEARWLVRLIRNGNLIGK